MINTPEELMVETMTPFNKWI